MSSIQFYINTSSNNFISVAVGQEKIVTFLETTQSIGRALFEIIELPPYLSSGFYLGKIYLLKVILDGTSYFLHQNDSGYQLSDTCDGCMTIIYTSLDLHWSFPNNISRLVPNSFISTLIYSSIDGTSTILSDKAIFYPVQPDISGNVMIYSPLGCAQDCTTCGYCPIDFTCNGGSCKSIVDPSVTFGLRMNRNTVITYDSTGKIGYYSPYKNISVDFENKTPFLVPQKWFYVDAPEGILNVGGRYPLYIYINGTKFYITMGNQSSTSTFNIILSPNISSDTLIFAPTRTANWGQFVFTNDDFINGKFINKSIALWQNNNLIKKPAVTSIATTSQISLLPTPKTENVLLQWIIAFLIILVFVVIFAIAIVYTAEPTHDNRPLVR